MGASPVGEDGRLTIAGDTWSQGLLGLSGEQIAEGLRSALASGEGWPPTLPEFRNACVATPSLATVREELRGEFAAFSPFTLSVYRRLDFWAYRRSEHRQAESLLERAYSEAREAVVRGEPLPEVPKLVTTQAPTFREPSRERVAECLAAMRKALGRA